MLGICLCTYKNCPKSKECLRYLNSLKVNTNLVSYADFQNICKEENNFKYFWKTESNLAEVKDESQL